MRRAGICHCLPLIFQQVRARCTFLGSFLHLPPWRVTLTTHSSTLALHGVLSARFPIGGSLLITLPCTLPICGVSSAPSLCVGVPVTPLPPSQLLPGVSSAPSLSVGIPVTPFPLPSPFPGFPLFPPPGGYPSAPAFHPIRPPYPFMGSPLHLSQEDSQGHLSHRLAFSKAFHNLPYFTLINSPLQPPVCRGG